MKLIEPITFRQLSASSKRFKKNGYKPYWGPSPAGHFCGMDVPALLLKFNPPISVEFRRW